MLRSKETFTYLLIVTQRRDKNTSKQQVFTLLYLNTKLHYLISSLQKDQKQCSRVTKVFKS